MTEKLIKINLSLKIRCRHALAISKKKKKCAIDEEYEL